MEQQGNKSTMCSVLFVEIVEYSRKPVSGQIALKERFNALLSGAIREVPADARIILDTGQGAAICFLGEAGNALKVALLLREGITSAAAHIDPPLQLRMGINYGPVRLVRHINEQPGIVGDGINVAKRVTGFAKPGQILATRAYHDTLARLTQRYAGMFQHEGSRTDKHVREHELYAIAPPGKSVAQPGQAQAAAAARPDAVHPAARKMNMRALYAGVFALLLAVVLFKFAQRDTAQIPAEQALPVADMPAQPAASQAAVAGPVAEQKPEAPPPSASIPEQPAAPAQETAEKLAGGTPHADMHRAGARVHISVMPWGEVYLDGRMRGVSPPLVELQVAPGKHTIEIRNTTFPPHTENIEIKAGEKIKIRHRFAN